MVQGMGNLKAPANDDADSGDDSDAGNVMSLGGEDGRVRSRSEGGRAARVAVGSSEKKKRGGGASGSSSAPAAKKKLSKEEEEVLPFVFECPVRDPTTWTL